MSRAVKGGSVVLIACFCAASAFAAQPSIPITPTNIIERSVATNTADWKAQPQYSYRVRTFKIKGTPQSTAKPAQSKTYEVLMVEGSPYERLVAINNEPLSATQEQLERDKLTREIRTRQHESSGDRNSRIAKYRNGRAQEHLLMQQMALAFNFKLVGEESIEGVDCYVLEADPKPAYQPPVEKARVLIGMRGRLWIDRNQYHWVRVQAEVIQPVEFGFFVAQVKPGTRFELDQAPVGGVWLPKHFSQTVNASVFGLCSMHSREESLYSDYQLPSLSAQNEAPLASAKKIELTH